MKNILVLDDNRFILEALSKALSGHLRNCTVLTASSCVKGAEILRTTPIDLILMDVEMPLEDGYRFIEEARNVRPHIPLCVMTGDCAPHVKERLKRMGISKYLEKPFQFEQLAELISKELKLFRDAVPQNGTGHA